MNWSSATPLWLVVISRRRSAGVRRRGLLEVLAEGGLHYVVLEGDEGGEIGLEETNERHI